ncbi:hypothetical protein [Jeotgalibacillus sp. R-1-5s-1]|uniref:hypothetical protein n=1 Tax=Jeotgalibacillus sp. R-1-5s-1 TaxID=2555897 RepID=UPI00106BA192|nr:hypothetical protein [Jeotgalibacillus sp. R-1-5s-1]TFE00006.1 hypothetical protein E2491_06060 [Jeotgalibacillus sp. R-1-5s-1]
MIPCGEGKKLEELVEKADLEQLWPGFTLTAYALYNREHVFLFRHPSCEGKDQPVVFEWDKRFVGNTLLLFEDYPTAIVNIEHVSGIEEVYPLLMHELFHGYQTLMDEKRFPDELIGVQYPVLKENIYLCIRERILLREALDTNSSVERQSLVSRYVSIREKRREMLGEAFSYETLIETVEGPSWYVEMKAFASIHNGNEAEAESRYREKLLEHEYASLNLRGSCYSSGLALCLLLNKIKPSWKEQYFKQDKTLYDLVKEQVPVQLLDDKIESAEYEKEAARIFNLVKQNRRQKIKAFSKFEGYQLTIEGPMRAVFFDPMNMVNVDHQLLHQYFVKMQIKEREYLINQPALTYYEDSVLQAKRLQLNLTEKPVVNGGSVNIPGIGEIQGAYSENGRHLHLVVSNQ